MMKIKYNRASLQDFLEPDSVIAFWKVSEPYGEFSNWYIGKKIDNRFLSSEHLFMFEKALLFNDLDTGDEILKASTCKEAKALGRKVANFNSEVWDSVKYKIMYNACLKKFSQDERLKALLLGTENKILIEASPLDTVWGIGLAVNNPKIYKPAYWQGENLLGFCLMEVRDKLKAGQV